MINFEDLIIQFKTLLEPVMPILIVMFGLLVGSFLNVCIYRLAKNESVVYPNSHCPKCHTQLGFFDLFPVLSYAFLGGRCRYCGKKISPRYACVELLTSIMFFTAYLTCGFTFKLFVHLVMFSVLIVISFIDLDWQIIPDQITINGTFLGFLLSFICWLHPAADSLSFYTSLNDSIWGIISGGGILYAIAIISGGGMGGGDVKLAALIGAVLGWKAVLLGLLLASFIGAFFGVLMLLTGIKKRKDYIAFGPYIAIGTIIVMILGTDTLVNCYFRFFSGGF